MEEIPPRNQASAGMVVAEEMLCELEELARSEQEMLKALEEWESLSVDPEKRYAYEMRLK